MTHEIWLILMRAVESLIICTLMGFLSKENEDLPLMTLMSNSKFEEKLAVGFKNGMTNLANLNMNSGKSENLHFNVLLLLIAYKVSAKKVQKGYLS